MSKHLTSLSKKVKVASQDLLTLPTKTKNAVLKDLAKLLLQKQDQIIRVNQKDVKAAEKKGVKSAFLDRLVLNEKRIKAMHSAVLDVVKLSDPVNEVTESYKRGDLEIQKVRIPLGVICMIYESRPNVTIDAATLCFKAGNAVILRGGSEVFHSNKYLLSLMHEALKKHGVSKNVVQLVPDTKRESMISLLKMSEYIDLVIPRGGEGLMRFVHEHAKVPVVKHDKGVCSLFVDESARLKRAIDVVVNAKTQRPGVCNALETLYVHEKIAKMFLPELEKKLLSHGVEIRADQKAKTHLTTARLARAKDFGEEYLDLILAIKVVKDVRDAIQNIRKYSSRHTESILTENKKNAELFLNSLDSSCVMVNTSTRFNDGGELGLGAEIGISTTKLHAYGPMGLRELTIPRFVVQSSYQIRD